MNWSNTALNDNVGGSELLVVESSIRDLEDFFPRAIFALHDCSEVNFNSLPSSRFPDTENNRRGDHSPTQPTAYTHTQPSGRRS